MKINSEMIEKALNELKDVLNNKEPRFLRTCPVCNQPLRQNDNVCISLKSTNSYEFTIIDYYCVEHRPDPCKITENNLLIGYSVVFDVKIEDTESGLTIEVNDYSYDVPDSKNI